MKLITAINHDEKMAKKGVDKKLVDYDASITLYFLTKHQPLPHFSKLLASCISKYDIMIK